VARASRPRVLQGKELSYNNIADADTALECVRQFPAGLRDRQARQPLRRRARRHAARGLRAAYRTDPTSAFGGIIAFNRRSTGTARAIVDRQFVEVIVAPRFAPRRAAHGREGERACC
jgi:phosphoribosylaminoimidazolecarboxamide formyltransferase / IMP cyclohydrolase